MTSLLVKMVLRHLSNGGFNNVTFKYNSTTADQLFNEAGGDTINGGVYRGPTDFNW